jgi:hypothetical protein
MNELMVLTELIEKELAAVTEADVERVDRNTEDSEDGDKLLGIVENPQARRLMALCGAFVGRTARFAHDARWVANSEGERDELLRESARADGFSDMCKEIFWAQVKDDLSLWDLRDGSLMLRKGWKVVECKKKELPNFLKVLGGRLPGGE